MRQRFTEVERQGFRRSLEKKMMELTKLEKDIVLEALPRPGEDVHPHILTTDMGSETPTREVDLKLAESELVEIENIKSALKRLENNEYGYCEECDEPIPTRRLQVLPEALYCVKCEEVIEKDQEAHRRGPSEVNFGKPIVKQFE